MAIRTLLALAGTGVLVLGVLWVIADNSQQVNVRLPLFQAMTVQLWQIMLGGVGLGAAIALAFDASGRVRRVLRERRRRRGRVELEEGERLYLEGVDEMASGRLDDALLSFQASEDYRGADPATMRRMAECQLRLDRPADAVETLERALDEDRQETATAYALAAALTAAGHPARARTLLQKTIAEDPSPPVEALAQLRDLLAAAGASREALATQQHIVSVAPPSGRIAEERRAMVLRHAHAVALLEGGEAVDAARTFRSVLDEDAQASPAWVRLGEAFLEAGNETAAVRAWREGFEKTGATAPLSALQDYYLDRTCPEDAISVWKEAIASRRNPVECQYLLGVLYDRLYMVDDAIRAFSALVGRGAPALDARLSRILESRGDLSGAVGRARRVIAAAPHLTAEFFCSACRARQTGWSDLCPECGAFGAIRLDLGTEPVSEAREDEPFPAPLVL